MYLTFECDSRAAASRNKYMEILFPPLKRAIDGTSGPHFYQAPIAPAVTSRCGHPYSSGLVYTAQCLVDTSRCLARNRLDLIDSPTGDKARNAIYKSSAQKQKLSILTSCNTCRKTSILVALLSLYPKAERSPFHSRPISLSSILFLRILAKTLPLQDSRSVTPLPFL